MRTHVVVGGLLSLSLGIAAVSCTSSTSSSNCADSRCLADAAEVIPSDGGLGADAGSNADSGHHATFDAGGAADATTVMPDAAMPVDGGGTGETDAGTAQDAGSGQQPDGGGSDAGTADTDGGASGGLVFASDWGTALGNSSDALRDTSKAVPWTTTVGTGLTVIPSTGLDFPTPNVLEVMATETAPGSAMVRFGHTRLTGLPVPAVGGSLFYRWYLRVAVPDTIDPTGGAPHPIQDGNAASQTNWMFETTISQDGTWGPRLWSFSGGNVFPNNRWNAPMVLSKNQTYRLELQIHRVGMMTFVPHARVYDSSNNLLYADEDIANGGGSMPMTFADDPVLNFNNVENLALLQAGNNAPGWSNVPSSAFPFVMFYQGAFCVRTDTWCGPWQAGEGE